MPTILPAFSIDADLGERVYSPNGGPLTVANREQFGRAVLASFATADGEPVVDRMHVGPEAGFSVYFERIDADGTGMHGYVDPVSRRVVQVG